MAHVRAMLERADRPLRTPELRSGTRWSAPEVCSCLAKLRAAGLVIAEGGSRELTYRLATRGSHGS